MQAVKVDLKRGDLVQVAIRKKRKTIVQRGTVVSTSPKHCLIDLGLYKESFGYEAVSKVLEDGRVNPVVKRLSKEAVDRVLAETGAVSGSVFDDWREELTVDDDPRPEWLERKPMAEEEDEVVKIDPDKLEEFVRRYDSGQKVADIQKEMGLNAAVYSRYFHHAEEQGLVTPRLGRRKPKADDATSADQAEVTEPRVEFAAEVEAKGFGPVKEGLDERQEAEQAAKAALNDAAHTTGADQAVVLRARAAEPFDLRQLSDRKLRQLDRALKEEAARRFFERV